MSEEPRYVAPYANAFEVLALTSEASPKDIKRAYRRGVIAHPPDHDPEGFHRIREAYELLSRPEDALEFIDEPHTKVPMPTLQLRPPVDLHHALPLAAMRAAVAEMDVRALLGGDYD